MYFVQFTYCSPKTPKPQIEFDIKLKIAFKVL